METLAPVSPDALTTRRPEMGQTAKSEAGASESGAASSWTYSI